MKPCLRCSKVAHGDYCWECFVVLERDMGINDSLEGKTQEKCGWPETRCDEHPHCRCSQEGKIAGKMQAIESSRGER